MHGRIDAIHHDGSGLFDGIPSPFSAVRYHSLLGVEPLPEDLRATAWTNDGLLMALAHRSRPLWGVQFHPESVCTEFGTRLLENFLNLARRSAKTGEPWAPRAVESSTPAKGRHRELFVRRLPPEQSAGLDPGETYETLFGAEEIGVWLDGASAAGPRFSFLAGGSRYASELLTYDAATGCVNVERYGATQTFPTDFFEYLKRRLGEVHPSAPDLPFAFNGGWIGYAGYELKADCGASAAHRASTPDSTFLLVERFVALDHGTGELYFVYLGEPADHGAAEAWFDDLTQRLAHPTRVRTHAAAEPIVFTASQTRAAYLSHIAASLAHIRDGESYEVCLTHQLKADTQMDPLAYYHRLRQSNPAPYAAFLRFPKLSIACSSPERFLQVSAEGAVETKPIKGTIRRGRTPEEDNGLREQLANDVKSRAENLMIVDLMRNDLGRVCEVGSVIVPGLMQIESYATVHQLVSTIAGQLRPGQTAVDCLRAAFPGGSMTGAPKHRTLEIIDSLEPEARGIYSGCLGYLAFNGAADFNIVIRTAVFEGNRVSIGVGGAIVALSDPVEEWEEALLKAEALLRAFGAYELVNEESEADLRALARNVEISGEPIAQPFAEPRTRSLNARSAL